MLRIDTIERGKSASRLMKTNVEDDDDDDNNNDDDDDDDDDNYNNKKAMAAIFVTLATAMPVEGERRGEG